MEGKELIRTFNKQYAAHLAKDKLTNAGLEVVLLEHDDTISELDGVFELYILPEDKDKANALLAEIDE